ncbi:MAG: CPBP family intramembrane metalloprotease [Rikenellaceae bacterium]|nr:CPBP family intramembrane metalloprotease [Rikenellaceae bacterium]
MMEDTKNEALTPSAPSPSENSPASHPASSSDASPRKPLLSGWLDAVVAVVILFVAQLIGGVLCVALGVLPPTEILTTSFDSEVLERAASLQARFVAISYLLSMLLGFALLWLYARLRRCRAGLEFGHRGWGTPIRLLNGYLLIWCITIALEPLSELLPGDQSALGSGGWLLLSAVVLAPLFEEVVFRGYVAGSLRRSYGALVAWIGSAVAFGLVHLIPSVVLSATLMGLVLGYFALRYRSLWLSIVLHAMNNATACFLRIVDMEDVTVRELMDGGTAYWVLYAVATAIALTSLVRMGRALSSQKCDNYSREV